MTRLLCHFEFGLQNEINNPHKTTIGDTIHQFQNGFWIDHNFQYTQNYQKLQYWIPPSKILYIENLKDNSNV